MHIDRGVMVPMLDGVRLATDVYRPASGGTWPTIILRTGYDRTAFVGANLPIVDRGYALVVQDLRGLHGSEGEHDLLAHDGADGACTVAWITAQRWSDGRVGAIGTSYLGLALMHTVAEAPDGLAAGAPVAAGGVFDGYGFTSRGVAQLDMLVSWTAATLLSQTAGRRGVSIGDDDLLDIAFAHGVYTAAAVAIAAGDMSSARMEQLGTSSEARDAALLRLFARPLHEVVDAVASVVPWVRDWAEHLDPDDPYWEVRDHTRRLDRASAALFHVGGWNDLFIRGTLRDFAALHDGPGAAPQRLLVHPFGHLGPGPVGEKTFDVAVQPEPFAFGGQLPAPIPGLLGRWFDRHVRGVRDGADDEPPITIYVMGADQWRGEHEWPLARTVWRRLHLHSEGNANSRRGDGRLAGATPADEPPDRYLFDPTDPVPTRGGTTLGFGVPAGMFDQHEIEDRGDVLVYTGDVLDSDLEATGPVRVELWASTTGVDTDFTAKLVDVGPDGTAVNVCDGVTRLRFRRERLGLVEPGSVQHVDIDLSPTSYVFRTGHRVRLQISSSNFPLFDPNPNTGGSLLLSPAHSTVEQTVFHDRMHPSAIVLPMIPR